ncbi:hypothetical protein HY624_00070 [Candidatus Uhrbacteria bacterium]|nr:hypothetical protein [Candidatus Uhrbacteria bacterium]
MRQRLPILTSIFALGSLIFIGAACTRGGADGGILRSDDGGTSWDQKYTLNGENNRAASIANYDITDLAIDPTNPARMYAGTWNNGALITDDAGEHWQAFLKNKGTVRNLLVNPRNAKMLYALTNDQALRTDDSGQNWKLIYPTPDEKVTLQSLSLGGNDGNVLYLGLSNGELLRSTTAGESWTRFYGFENRIERVLANTNDSNIVYVATARRGLWKSADGGRSWVTFTNDAQWEKADGSRSYRTMALDPTIFDGLLYGSAFGILRTRDGGMTWSSMITLEQPGNFSASTIVVHPRDGNTLLYGTRQGLYQTHDGGATWKTVKLNSTRAPIDLLYNPANPSILYLGFAK